MTMCHLQQRGRKKNGIIKKVCFVLVWVIVCAGISYRGISWYLRYQDLSNKMLVSSVESEYQEIPFPYISLCNLNPARGTSLFDMDNSSGTSGQDYELFIDSINGKRSSINMADKRYRESIYKLIDRASHPLDNMLKSCSVGNVPCSSINFTKSLLPNGACYTLNVDVPSHGDVFLMLDPEGFDYLIPNEHFIGFRLLLHSKGDPLWASMPSAVYVGPKFQTVVRAVGMKKIYSDQCVTQQTWARCIHRCMEDLLKRRCGCNMLGSTACKIADFMKCSLKMDQIVDDLSISQCICPRSCVSLTYSIESVTQALKSTLFTRLATIKSPLTTINDDTINSGELIQIWAYLREADRSVFEKLRKLSKVMENLYKLLKNIQTTVKHIYDIWPRSTYRGKRDVSLGGGLSPNTNECLNPEVYTRNIDNVHKLGIEIHRRFIQSFLFKNYDTVPQRNMHIHLVNLFFGEIEENFANLKKEIPFNDLVSEVTMLSHRHSLQSCLTELYKKHQGGRVPNFIKIIEGFQSTLSLTDSYFKHILNNVVDLAKTHTNLRSQIPSQGRRSSRSLTMRPSRLDNDRMETLFNSLVTLIIRLSPNKKQPLHLESAQQLFDPKLEIFDLVLSGIVLAFLLMLLVEICSKKKCCVTTKSSRTPVMKSTPQPCSRGCDVSPWHMRTLSRYYGNFLSEDPEETRWQIDRKESRASGDIDSPMTSFHFL